MACLWGNVEIPLRFCKKCRPQATNRQFTGHESVPKPKLELLEVAILILYSVVADFFISVHYLLRKMQNTSTILLEMPSRANELALYRSREPSKAKALDLQCRYGQSLRHRDRFLHLSSLVSAKDAKYLYDFGRTAVGRQRIVRLQVTKAFQSQSLSAPRSL